MEGNDQSFQKTTIDSLTHDFISDEEGQSKGSGRRKIKIEYIQEKSRRHITFSKRKAGIMKKAYELSTLTGTQVLLLVASETGHVYTFATPKLQPLITQSQGKNLIQQCLNDEPTTNNLGNNFQYSQVEPAMNTFMNSTLGYNEYPETRDFTPSLNTNHEYYPGSFQSSQFDQTEQ